MGRCVACECSKTSKRVVFGEGPTKAKIVSIGEAPGPDEDEQGHPFIGRAGKLHDKLLDDSGIDRKDCWVTNVGKCFPGRDEKGGIGHPSEVTIATCSELYLFKELKLIKPRVILAWGLVAAHVLIKDAKNLTMGDIAGRVFETEWGKVIPLYHPSFFLRNPGDHAKRQLVKSALEEANQLAGLGATGTYVDQVKTESHQEDKSVIAALEAKSGIFEHKPWIPKDGTLNREYTTAWSDGKDIVLVYKDENGKKQYELVDDFEWYFYMKTSDVLRINEQNPKFWSYWMNRGVVHKMRADPVNKAWTMIYATRWVVRTHALREHLLESYLTLWGDDQALKDKFPKDYELKKLLDEIEYEVMQYDPRRPGSECHWEADLTPSRRFMTDYDIKIQAAYDEMYVDIETDDTLPLIDRKMLAERRILSIAWEIIWADKNRKPETGFIKLEKETDRAEREMLEEFGKVLESTDVVYAWNGNNFDFPILRLRMRKFGVKVRWDLLHTIDLLRTWMRYFQRGATANTSFSLQSIASHVLKQGKLDWKEECRKQGKNIKTFIELYRQAPDILEKYNRDDCHKLVELEKFSGFAKIDQVFSRIGNCFARDYHITTKIDSLLLKRGKQSGVHFPTKKVKTMTTGGKDAIKMAKYGHEGALYEGAYVLDPKRGLYEDVAAMDFKSLYPSVMVAWNISPETYITNEEAAKLPKDHYTECPTGAKFLVKDRDGNPLKGFVPSIFADTGEKRKVYQKLQAEQPVGSDLFLLYYRLAYSFKRLGLSFYGDMGNVESRYFKTEVAKAVTLSGQHVLKQALDFAANEGLVPLYGDTDSMYVKMGFDEAEHFVKRCNSYLKKHLWEKFKVPEERFVVELEYENYFKRMFFVRKKRYAGLMTMYKGKKASFTEIKGFECMRSDGVEFARQMQRTIIEMIVRERKSSRDIVNFLFAQQALILGRQAKLEDLMVTKAVTKPLDSYKAKTVHVEIARQLRDSGGEFFVGMKIGYLIVGAKPRLSGVLFEEYGQGKNRDLVYDANWYWDKMIFPPVYRILAVVYPAISWEQLFTNPQLRTKEAAAKAVKMDAENGENGDHDEEGDV